MTITNEASYIRLEALRLAQSEGLRGRELDERAAYLADFIQHGRELADSRVLERANLAEDGAVPGGGLVEMSGTEWEDGPHIKAGTRLAVMGNRVPAGWRPIERNGYLLIRDKV